MLIVRNCIKCKKIFSQTMDVAPEISHEEIANIELQCPECGDMCNAMSSYDPEKAALFNPVFGGVELPAEELEGIE